MLEEEESGQDDSDLLLEGHERETCSSLSISPSAVIGQSKERKHVLRLENFGNVDAEEKEEKAVQVPVDKPRRRSTVQSESDALHTSTVGVVNITPGIPAKTGKHGTAGEDVATKTCER